nr:flippase [Thalassobacillus sp. CUG 92003]
MPKRITSNLFLTRLIEAFFGKGSYIVFTLIFSIVTTRLYGAEIFGKYSYAFTLVSLLMVVAKFGMDTGFVYSIPRNKNKHISMGFLVNLLMSIVLICTGLLFTNDYFVKIMLPLIWCLSIEQLFFGIYRSKGEIKKYFFVNGFLAMLLRIFLVLVFYFLTGKNPFSIAIAVYISFIFSITVYFFQNKSNFKRIVLDKDFLKYSFPLLFSGILGTLIGKTDILMIGNMLTNRDVGIYQIILQLSNSVAILLVVFNTVFAPQISTLYHEQRHEDMKQLYIKTTRLLAIVSFLITLTLILGNAFFLNVFGTEFIEGDNALIFRSIGQFINISVGGVWIMLSMTGAPHFQMYSNFGALTINIVLNLLLIPKYGISGAAFASMITIIVTNAIGYILVSRKFKIKVFKFF